MPISWSWWVAHPWKNELELQTKRVTTHFEEVLCSDFVGEHNPHAMLERAIVLAAFSIRRLIEKKLVTDKFSAQTISIRAYPAVKENFRRPYYGATGGLTFRNYDFAKAQFLLKKPSDIANEIIHSSQIMVVKGENLVSNGLLIASDKNLHTRIIHITLEEFVLYTQSVLNDRVEFGSDEWDFCTGQVNAKRL